MKKPTDAGGRLAAIGHAARRLKDALLDLLYPKDIFCLCCDKAIAPDAKDGLCPACLEALEELEAQQAELQTVANRYGEVKMWLDSFAEHIQSGEIMNAEDGMVMKQLVEQIIVGDDGIEVCFKCGIVARHEYL